MEHLLLKVLAFDLTVPTTNQFLLQYLRRQGVCVRTENLAKVCMPCDFQELPMPRIVKINFSQLSFSSFLFGFLPTGPEKLFQC